LFSDWLINEGDDHPFDPLTGNSIPL
jgi:hypothetical protein